MSDLFNLAAKRALQMSQPSPQKISINIEICQPSEGGLSSIQKGMDIGGEPHKLAYINSDESSLLKAIGAEGEPMEGTNGIPAYFVGGGGPELLEQIMEMMGKPKDTRRAMDIYLDTFASRDRGEYPRLERDEGDLLGDIYNRPGAEQRHKNLKFLERIAANLEEPDSGEEVTDEVAVEETV